MTKRQEKIWRRKMLSLEKGLLDHYRRHHEAKPDGSFCMSAFKNGYYLAQRKRRESKRGS